MVDESIGLVFTGALFSKKVKSVSKKGTAATALSAALLSGVGFGGNNAASANLFYGMNPIENSILNSGKSSNFQDSSAEVASAKKGILGSIASFVSSTLGGVLGVVDSFTGPLARLGYAANQASNLYYMYQYHVQDKVAQFIPKDDPIKGLTFFEASDRIASLTEKYLFGQEKVKELVDRAVGDILKNHGTQPNILYLLGPSGCGKNVLTDKILRPVLCGTNTKPLVINADFFDTEDVKDAVSIKQQLVGFRKHGDRMVPSPFLRYIKDNPNGLIVFNELDKVRDKSPEKSKEGYCAITNIEEVLRTILDYGYIMLPNGETIDCRGITICFTSNELEECILDVKNLENIDLSKIKDPSGSRTIVKHDKSFINRPNIFVMPFEPLAHEEYIRIAASGFLDLAEDLKRTYGLHILYRDNFEKICPIIALEAMKLNKGGRSVATVVRDINIKVLNYVRKMIDEVRSKAPFILQRARQFGEKISAHEKRLLRIYNRVILGSYENFKIDLEVDYDPQNGFFVKEREAPAVLLEKNKDKGSKALNLSGPELMKCVKEILSKKKKGLKLSQDDTEILKAYGHAIDNPKGLVKPEKQDVENDKKNLLKPDNENKAPSASNVNVNNGSEAAAAAANDVGKLAEVPEKEKVDINPPGGEEIVAKT